MLVIPLQAVPSQSLAVVLGGQPCGLTIYQKSTGLFIDVALGGVTILSGALCQNANRIVRDAYLGFPGDLAFFDTQGTSDPTFEGLGGRYFLAYLTPGE